MGKKIVRLTEESLNKIFGASVGKVLSEASALDSANVGEVTSDISMVAERFDRYAQEIRLFIEEYNTFFNVLSQCVQNYGLNVSDIENNLEDFCDNPNEGLSFKYVLGLGIDPTTLYGDDASYEEYTNKIAELGEMLEDAINPRNYKACSVSVNYDEEIEVICEFNVWE